MRILMTTDAVGGVWTYSVELSRALADAGIEVVLATLGPPPRPHQEEELGDLDGVRLEVGPFRLEWMEDAEEDVVRSGEWLLDLQSHWRADLVHLNGYAHGALAWDVPALVVAHSCVYSWWWAVKGEEPPADRHAYRHRVRRGLETADLVIAPTSWMLSRVAALYGVAFEGRVIPNGRTGNGFSPGACEDLVLSAGRLWDEGKNLAALDAAAADLSWPVMVAGETADPDGRGVDARHTEPLGRLSSSDISQWMGRAGVFAHPARYEPFGLAPLEAALSGCALVLGDIDSLREVWGEDAAYADPDDPASLCRTIQGLIDDEPARRSLAARARRRALGYTPQRMARDYRETYESLLAAPRRIRCAS